MADQHEITELLSILETTPLAIDGKKTVSRILALDRSSETQHLIAESLRVRSSFLLRERNGQSLREWSNAAGAIAANLSGDPQIIADTIQTMLTEACHLDIDEEFRAQRRAERAAAA